MVFSRPGPRTGEQPLAEIRTPPKAPLTRPVHDALAGIPPGPAGPPAHIPPVRFPQGSLEWLIAISSVPADPVGVPLGGAGGLVETGQLILFGGSFDNVSTNAAVVQLLDGGDAKGTLVAKFIIPASSQFQLSLPRAGVLCEIGLFSIVTGGSLAGTAYIGHVWKYPFTPPGE